MSKSAPCPCSSGKSYAECCAPFHDRKRHAQEGEELVRSRYSAFALGKVDYLYDTLHEDHPDRRHAPDQIMAALRAASASFKYMGLTIIEAEPRDRDGYCRVLYLARLFRKGTDVSFIELAEFLHDGIGLRYRNGKTMDAPGMRVPPLDLAIATFQPS
ncbi:MAG: SEC-C domain-containing protein [Deltaproteobacteria bacterium]|nr:SEC-C domain-containing protein [Deltaproteobacteria bacterium]